MKDGATTDSLRSDPQARGARLWGRQASWVFGRLALQNVGRRPARTLLLVFAVALSSGTMFATTTLIQGITASMVLGFSRLGADLLVVPKETLVNLTAALLTVEPTPHTLDASLADEVARIPGVRQVAPQRFLRFPDPHSGGTGQVDAIVFDPRHDLTVLPWLGEQLDRPLQNGDLIIGGLLDHRVGEQVLFFGQPLTIYGQVRRTGVGTYDRAVFLTFDTAKAVAQASRLTSKSAPLLLDQGRISALLVQLDVDGRPEAVRFAIAKHSEVKVVAAGSHLISARQAMTALSGGTLALGSFMLAAMAVMVSLVFSAIVVERRRELGLLRTIGAKQRQIARMIVLEAVFVTSLGGLAGTVFGVLLLRLSQRSLIFRFELLNVPFVWPAGGFTVWAAVGCVLAAALVGVLGAIYPAWRITRQEPYDLICSDG